MSIPLPKLRNWQAIWPHDICASNLVGNSTWVWCAVPVVNRLSVTCVVVLDESCNSWHLHSINIYILPNWRYFVFFCSIHGISKYCSLCSFYPILNWIWSVYMGWSRIFLWVRRSGWGIMVLVPLIQSCYGSNYYILMTLINYW